MYCYCRSVFWEKLGAKESPLGALQEEFPDGEEHCWDWWKDYARA